MKECILSRRDQTKVAWHEVPGNKRKVEPVPKGRLICSLVPEIFFVELHVVRFCFCDRNCSRH
jgi:hypothetical protein